MRSKAYVSPCGPSPPPPGNPPPFPRPPPWTPWCDGQYLVVCDGISCNGALGLYAEKRTCWKTGFCVWILLSFLTAVHFPAVTVPFGCLLAFWFRVPNAFIAHGQAHCYKEKTPKNIVAFLETCVNKIFKWKLLSSWLKMRENSPDKSHENGQKASEWTLRE